ncbi:type I phosphomannose isomerase catalytic subunit [Cetobacterium sp. SF1]|uniref:type I phosphomannose isomerase catalytic subunit n=1 Tax=unclassified Cetobacterium TaxID=2630983 RepID=UPI003CEFBF4A
MYPLKFKKHLVEKVWGGKKFQTILGMELPRGLNVGESWEVSCHKGGLSFVENGELKDKSLIDIIAENREEILGEEIVEKFGDKFPLLIKYLDINDKLSVQVHPSNEYALRVEGEFGKSESWYVIDASEDAKLIMGLKEGITKEIFKKKVENSDFTDIFNIISVKKGDFININPGTVHGTLEGSILICETQQNSDTTYRIYDFDRLVDGKKRPLHLEKALDVINFGLIPEVSTEESRKKIKLLGGIKEEMVRGQYFNIDRLLIDGVFKDEINSNFKVYSILDGEGTLMTSGKIYEIKKGDTYFIPAKFEIVIGGKVEILKSYI